MNKYDYYIGILFSNYLGKANWFELSGGLKIDPGETTVFDWGSRGS